MSIPSVSIITSSSELSSSAGTAKPALPQEVKQEVLPKIEFKTVSKIGLEALQSVVDEANAMLEYVRPDIKFVIDEATKNVVILMLEPETGDVINRYPTEQALAISNAIVESQARLAEKQAAFKNSTNQALGFLIEQRT